MRRVASVAAVLLLAITACGRINQQQDTLAPRVAAPEPPAAVEVARASSPRGGRDSGPAEDQQPIQASQPAQPSASAAPASAIPISSAPPAAPASAKPAASASDRPTPGAQPAPAVAPTASRTLLQPVQHEYETWNNCAPVTAEMVLSYYGISKRQTEIAPVLRPHPKNFSVRMDQIAAYLEQFGLEGQPLIGGSVAQLKALVSNNVPVVVEDQLSLQDDYGHFRVVRGFDDAAGVVIFGDSYFGPTNRLTYGLYQELWKRHNYSFMPVYRPAQRPLVQAILGRDFDPSQNAEHALNDARQAAASRPDDGFAWLNFGSDLYRAGNLPEARAAWDRARQLQLTGRTLWYTIWPAAVYNRLGEYQHALEVVAIPLGTDPFNAEALLERGNAYRGLGNKDRARADYAMASEVDPSLLPARNALASV
ncbi:MAG TPA: C39 family peptidase [Chloroflexota bacterium]|nr:C39 family peptidase [Chloroflexota bacterium]